MRTRSLPSGLIGVVVFTLATCGAEAPAADEPTCFTLENGLRVRMVPLEGEGKLFVILGVRAGFFDEPADLPHLAHVTEHLVVFCTPDGSDEARDAERWFRAGRSNGETLPGWMYFDLQVEPGELESALRVQAVRLTRPEFTGDLLSREIPRTLAELEHLEESETYGTGKFAFSAFVQTALHGRPEALIKARTKDITIEDVRRFHAAHFRPDRAILCLVGDFDTARVRKAIEEVYGPIPKPQGIPGRPRLRQGDTERTVHWDALTRHLILAWPTPPAPLRPSMGR